LYDVAIQKAYQEDCRTAISQGIGFGMFFFAMYAAYGLGEFGSLAPPTTSTNSHPLITSIQLWHHAHQ
jgi:hypothetical protein